MAKPPVQQTTDIADPTLSDADPYELPDELIEPADPGTGETDPGPPPKRWPPAVKVGLVVGALALAIGGGLLYRAQHRAKVLRLGLARAADLMRLDTATAYREAADLLAPLGEMDPAEARSARALALAMLSADYRDTAAEKQAMALLAEPVAMKPPPRDAQLALAVLALGRNALGDATAAAQGARGTPWADLVQARIAIRAGNLGAAVEPAQQAAQDGALAAALALNGDVARRARQDAAGAAADYRAALAASPLHPRAAYGLAKLALAGQAPPAEATAPLERLVAEKGTPAVERARAALHLASLRLRAGDQAGAEAALAVVELDDPGRAWARRAANVASQNRGTYRAVLDAPSNLLSASDDDPPELPSIPPPPPPEPTPEPPRPVVRAPARAHAKAAAVSKAKPAARPSGKAAVKKPVAKVTSKAGAKPAAKAPARATAKKPAATAKSAVKPAAKKAPVKKPAAKAGTAPAN